MKLGEFPNNEFVEKKLGKYFLEGNSQEKSNDYRNAEPFAHTVVDNFLSEEYAKSLSASFENLDLISFKHYNESKSWTDNKNLTSEYIGLFNLLNSPKMLSILSDLTGIENLIPDTQMGSGGAHRSTKGGFLNIHADFTVHPYQKKWRRRINLLVYLNEEWDQKWGGDLELWDKGMTECKRKVSPFFNRCVIFNTDKDSWHGHPHKLNCPSGVGRKSVAMYYYTEEEITESVPTNYQPRPEDSFFKGILIGFDKLLIKVFHNLKGAFGVTDKGLARLVTFWKK